MDFAYLSHFNARSGASQQSYKGAKIGCTVLTAVAKSCRVSSSFRRRIFSSSSIRRSIISPVREIIDNRSLIDQGQNDVMITRLDSMTVEKHIAKKNFEDRRTLSELNSRSSLFLEETNAQQQRSDVDEKSNPIPGELSSSPTVNNLVSIPRRSEKTSYCSFMTCLWDTTCCL